MSIFQAHFEGEQLQCEHYVTKLLPEQLQGSFQQITLRVTRRFEGLDPGTNEGLHQMLPEETLSS